MKVFGERLRELRQSKGYTQAKLGEVFKVTGNTISSWESDKQEPSLEVLLGISIFFGISLDYLMGKSDY